MIKYKSNNTTISVGDIYAKLNSNCVGIKQVYRVKSNGSAKTLEKIYQKVYTGTPLQYNSVNGIDIIQWSLVDANSIVLHGAVNTSVYLNIRNLNIYINNGIESLVHNESNVKEFYFDNISENWNEDSYAVINVQRALETSCDVSITLYVNDETKTQLTPTLEGDADVMNSTIVDTYYSNGSIELNINTNNAIYVVQNVKVSVDGEVVIDDVGIGNQYYSTSFSNADMPTSYVIDCINSFEPTVSISQSATSVGYTAFVQYALGYSRCIVYNSDAEAVANDVAHGYYNFAVDIVNGVPNITKRTAFGRFSYDITVSND